ncbi:MAG: hypothetical protein AAF750_06350 [Planctomycetota bacterium]
MPTPLPPDPVNLGLAPEPPHLANRDSSLHRIMHLAGGQRTDYFIKSFKASPLRQRLAARFNRHPAQREALWQARLAGLGLPAATPLHHWMARPGDYRMLYPDLGQPLPQWWKQQHATEDFKHRRNLAHQLGQLLAKLAAAYILWPTAHANDFFVAPDHTLQFINAGSCRGARGIPLLARLLPLMQQVQADLHAAAKGHPQPHRVRPNRTDRLQVYRAMLHTFPEPLDGMQHLPTHADLK